MEKFETRVRVRYEETDQMGAVHHSKYIVYFELGRTEFMRHLGFPYSELEKDGFFLPITECYAKYHAPCKFEDEIIIVTSLGEIKNVRIKFNYKIFLKADIDGQKLLAEGYTVLGCLNKEGKIIKLPEKIRRLRNA